MDRLVSHPLAAGEPGEGVLKDRIHVYSILRDKIHKRNYPLLAKGHDKYNFSSFRKDGDE